MNRPCVQDRPRIGGRAPFPSQVRPSSILPVFGNSTPLFEGKRNTRTMGLVAGCRGPTRNSWVWHPSILSADNDPVNAGEIQFRQGAKERLQGKEFDMSSSPPETSLASIALAPTSCLSVMFARRKECGPKSGGSFLIIIETFHREKLPTTSPSSTSSVEAEQPNECDTRSCGWH